MPKGDFCLLLMPKGDFSRLQLRLQIIVDPPLPQDYEWVPENTCLHIGVQKKVAKQLPVLVPDLQLHQTTKHQSQVSFSRKLSKSLKRFHQFQLTNFKIVKFSYFRITEKDTTFQCWPNQNCLPRGSIHQKQSNTHHETNSTQDDPTFWWGLGRLWTRRRIIEDTTRTRKLQREEKTIVQTSSSSGIPNISSGSSTASHQSKSTFEGTA